MFPSLSLTHRTSLSLFISVCLMHTYGMTPPPQNTAAHSKPSPRANENACTGQQLSEASGHQRGTREKVPNGGMSCFRT